MNTTIKTIAAAAAITASLGATAATNQSQFNLMDFNGDNVVTMDEYKNSVELDTMESDTIALMESAEAEKARLQAIVDAKLEAAKLKAEQEEQDRLNKLKEDLNELSELDEEMDYQTVEIIDAVDKHNEAMNLFDMIFNKLGK